MKLIPIELKESDNQKFLHQPACVEILSIYPEYYKKIGFNKPWIGYFVSLDGKDIVGSAGFKGRPKDGKVEIAYYTFKEYEGRGIGTEICRQLLLLALAEDSNVTLAARTLPDGHASMAILLKNGFENAGMVKDEEDGNVIEWILPEANARKLMAQLHSKK